jgi:membrane-bound lytic murein transglycosylase A
MKLLRLLIIGIISICCTACVCSIKKVQVKEQFAPPWDANGFLEAVKDTITYFNKTSTATLRINDTTVSKQQYLTSLEKLASFLKTAPSRSALQTYLDAHFQIASTRQDAFFTGYYSPTLLGSPHKSAEYPYPIYGKPSDLVTIDLDKSISSTLPPETPVINRGQLVGSKVKIPYCSRQQIETSNCLAGKAPILAYAKDPIDLFFLQVQGSGTLRFASGETWHLGFADKNGHPYRAIGKTMLDRGMLTKGNVSMQSIKAYLRAHPEQIQDILASNPSYVFFSMRRDVPRGNLGVPVHALHSYASDQTQTPPGILSLVTVQSPNGFSLHAQPMFNHDIGGAIRGANRFDLYMGASESAEQHAGALQAKGNISFLVPREKE